MKPEEIKQQGGKIVIIGAGEFGRIAYDYFNVDSNYEVVAFAVENKFLEKTAYCEIPVIAFEELPERYPPSDFDVFVALTYGHLNRDRSRLVEMSRQAGYRSVSYLSSSAFVSPNISIGENTFVFENNTIQHLCQLEDNVILWSGNHVGHRSVIRKNCFISSHVVISGFCDIGDNCFVGVNSTIGNNLTIGKDCTIGAGSIITSDLLENSSIAPPKSPVRENISRRLWKVRDNGMD